MLIHGSLLGSIVISSSAPIVTHAEESDGSGGGPCRPTETDKFGAADAHFPLHGGTVFFPCRRITILFPQTNCEILET